MKKKLFLFICGAATGALLTFLIFQITKKSGNDSAGADSVEEVVAEEETKPELPEGVTLFDELGDVINESSFKVIQVIYTDFALVIAERGLYGYSGPIYALVNMDRKYYYDDEIINVSEGEEVRQMGIYRYNAKNGLVKTVPIIMIREKQ